MISWIIGKILSSIIGKILSAPLIGVSKLGQQIRIGVEEKREIYGESVRYQKPVEEILRIPGIAELNKKATLRIVGPLLFFFVASIPLLFFIKGTGGLIGVAILAGVLLVGYINVEVHGEPNVSTYQYIRTVPAAYWLFVPFGFCLLGGIYFYSQSAGRTEAASVESAPISQPSIDRSAQTSPTPSSKPNAQQSKKNPHVKQAEQASSVVGQRNTEKTNSAPQGKPRYGADYGKSPAEILREEAEKNKKH